MLDYHEGRTSAIAPHEMTSFFNLSSCWILFVGSQVLKSTVKTAVVTSKGGLDLT